MVMSQREMAMLFEARIEADIERAIMGPTPAPDPGPLTLDKLLNWRRDRGPSPWPRGIVNIGHIT